MNWDEIKTWITAQGVERFSRSSGPGGQHVNTTASRVQLSIETASLPGLSDEQRARLPRTMSVTVQDERSQWTNRERAVERLLVRLERLLTPRTPRRATKPTRASKERRLESKRRAAGHRRNRSVDSGD